MLVEAISDRFATDGLEARFHPWQACGAFG